MLKRSVVLLSLAASACSNEIARPIEPPLAWEKLADGSQVALGDTDPSAEEASSLLRCWTERKGYDCVAIRGGEWKDVRRTRPASLPATIWAEKTPPGYDCSIGSVGSGYQEHINAKTGKLTEHVVSGLFGPLERSWTKDYVARYLAANGIEPETLWYDCRAVTQAVQKGSNATIASSSITRALLNGETGGAGEME